MGLSKLQLKEPGVGGQQVPLPGSARGLWTRAGAGVRAEFSHNTDGREIERRVGKTVIARFQMVVKLLLG